MTPMTLIDAPLQPDSSADPHGITDDAVSTILLPISAPPTAPHTTSWSTSDSSGSSAGGRVPRFNRRFVRLPTTIPKTITDQEIRKCRLLLALHDTALLSINDQPAAALELCCTFQPAAGLRFVSAQLLINLETPEGIKIIDLAPKQVECDGVAVSVTQGGRFAIEYLGTGGQREVQRTASFKHYTCLVSGSDDSTPNARWEFNEVKQSKQGLGQQHALYLLVSAAGILKGRIYLSAEIERSGLMGVHDRARRWLRLGALPDVPYLPLQIQLPG